MDDIISVLKSTFDQQKFAPADQRAVSIIGSGVTITLAMPVSSSMERKITPLGVPGAVLGTAWLQEW
jgi:hypothetical protein